VESSYKQRYTICAKKGNVDVIIHLWVKLIRVKNEETIKIQGQIK
jgi:hypothetical protein